MILHKHTPVWVLHHTQAYTCINVASHNAEDKLWFPYQRTMVPVPENYGSRARELWLPCQRTMVPVPENYGSRTRDGQIHILINVRSYSGHRDPYLLVKYALLWHNTYIHTYIHTNTYTGLRHTYISPPVSGATPICLSSMCYFHITHTYIHTHTYWAQTYIYITSWCLAQRLSAYQVCATST